MKIRDIVADWIIMPQTIKPQGLIHKKGRGPNNRFGFRNVGNNRANENFADGKGPGRPGDSKRAGIPKGATITQLKKIRSSKTASARKKQLAHWQINMRQGRKRNK